MIRKNISLMTRNVSDTSISAPFDFVILNNQDLRLDPAILTPYITAGKRSLIVIGWDIILNDVDINAGTDAVAWAKSPIALIALKGASGKWGNIIVSDDVKRIYAYLYAEGTLFSGIKPAATINSYTQVGYFNIPQNQLYIRGFVVSKNTIGWSQQKPTAICPALVTGCNQANVYDYDWDNFRTYDPLQIATQGSLPVERSGVERLKNAAMIIEYDSRILTDPPPGLREAQ